MFYTAKLSLTHHMDKENEESSIIYVTFLSWSIVTANSSI